ncbi:MAG: hypothetical protein A2566_01770 [Candidatus Zambryskibacteria bacterium RIFOXYD1_FULL_40_13]|nr:MAG: hypothetical protein UT25_C0001G0048 [Parcubacteria group bacterium GW2011_GWC1_39_12]KKR19572.1 MAG: hypothetical protein UT49_C0001G0048 [Parcubacteria group bacterium GW2011_GWF1_39_37]KKR35726.1 MAG: hypothetical protein UT68_C0001G0049 [Parcubacteria group bacterium GW2011_GWC2_40_10]KKR52540.1 MAG: hypothetical protein UT89_C0001G0048 [Parcubacteria group bacterium GW2011_GWE1_40_20]KKR65266.1 MAG: hypothetical protein UU06_C0024G0002 [Parcubacteria group bacterium GW2011_GWB1_40_
MLPNRSISHEEFLKRKRRRKLWKFGVAIFLVLLLLGLVSYASHRREIRISKIELNGGILVTQEDLEPKALEFMYGSHLWLFPRNNALWYPHGELEKYLRDTFKRIDRIDISRKNFNTLVVDIKERKPFAMWCEKNNSSVGLSTTTPVTIETEACYFIDQNSTIFAKAPHFSGDAYFKYYGLVASSTTETPIGKEYIADATLFSDISNFVTKAKELEVRPLYVLAKENDEFSLILHGGGEIYFDLKKPLSLVGQNLEALLRTTFASSTGDLKIEYIDLRYGNKLFYKLKNN